MTHRAVVSLLLSAALLAPAPSLAAHRKPVAQSYQVTLPVPYAVDAATHCSDGVDGASQDRRHVVLPDRGRFDVQLSGFVGDWVLELYDAKGRLLAQAAALEPTDPAPVRKLSYKKGTKGQRVTVAVCNVTGGPRADVAWTFSFH